MISRRSLAIMAEARSIDLLLWKDGRDSTDGHLLPRHDYERNLPPRRKRADARRDRVLHTLASIELC